MFVTGATGFVGRHLCAALVADHAKVSALVRPGSSRPLPNEVARVECALSDADRIRRAARGMDVVIHLAGLAHVPSELGDAPLDAYRDVNVKGTHIIANAAAEMGARFVFMSSIAAVTASASDPIDENQPPTPATPYGVSKLEAERLVCDLAHEAGLSAAILRPPMIYGPGMRGNPLRLFAFVDRGVPVPVAVPDSLRSLAFVGNVTNAIMGVARLRTPTVETFYVDDGRVVATADFIRGIAAALGRPARLLRIPAGALRTIGKAGDVCRRVAGRSPITTRTIEPFVQSLVLDSSKLRQAVQTTSWYSTSEGLRLTAAWFKAR